MTVSLVLGGARSGKSAHAESLVAAAGGARIYLATAAAGDEEMAARIAAHRARRGPGWRTIEEPLDIAPVIAREARTGVAILVDCLTLWLANLMAAGRDAEAAGTGLIGALEDAAGTTVVVANEVGLGIVPENALARRFRDEAGRLNQRVAAAAADVVLMAAGLPLPLKRDGRIVHG